MKIRELKVLSGISIVIYPMRVNRYAILDRGIMTWFNTKSEIREYLRFRREAQVFRDYCISLAL